MQNNVKERREAAALTQEQLAEKSGVARSTIAEIETSKRVPGVDVALWLARALDCRVEDLFHV